MILHHNPDPSIGVDINTDPTELTIRVMLRVMLVVNVKSWFMAKCLILSTLTTITKSPRYYLRFGLRKEFVLKRENHVSPMLYLIAAVLM